jgi:hypothetical protein
MQIVTIPQKFEVDGQTFDSMDAAQEYIDSNADRMRLAAFVQHLKDNGAQRVSKAVTDAITTFIAFEKGTVDTSDGDVADGPNESPATTGETTVGMDSDTSTEPGKSEGAGVAGTAGTFDDQQSSASEPEQSEESEKQSGSAHVDGPDEDDENDPLAGLDLGDE